MEFVFSNAKCALSSKLERLINREDSCIIYAHSSAPERNELLRFAFASLGHRKHVLDG